MKLKVTTLTPVHISTGNLNPCYVYHYKADPDPQYYGQFVCYDFQQLLKQIPYKDLSNVDFLSTKDKSKRYVAQFFRKRINFNNPELEPQYYLTTSINPGDDDNSFYLDVKEQVKSLNMPYIPGSSIKGAVLNALYFYILSNRKDNVKQFLNEYGQNYHDYGKFEEELMSYLFDDDFKDIWKQMSSCLICRDIPFNTLILCQEERLNMAKQNPHFTNMECIDYNQSVEDEFIVIDKAKKKIFDENLAKKSKDYQVLSQALNVKNIILAFRNYSKYLLKEDKEYFENIKHESSSDIVQFINKLDLNDKNSCILRIGNSTNYFYKTVSLFIKTTNNAFYHKYFYELFSPVNKPRNNQNTKRLPKADDMPKTRVVVEFDEKYYLAGMIKIECQ